MHPLWFEFYGRRKKQQRRGFYNSCGFEHVFVGELRGKKVIGFHNWLQMLLQEESNSLTYTGNRGVQQQPAIVASVCFNWFNRKKDFSTIMLGVEPEFELALYTATHLLKANGASKLTLDASRRWRLEVQNFENDFALNHVHAAYLYRLKD
ncbi:hypothetical protein BOX15_Mlig019087g3 [Macrostomum lignano]|nr:hypothetical protein BOX15_Mlig019087g3 [Macrostomum lignano]